MISGDLSAGVSVKERRMASQQREMAGFAEAEVASAVGGLAAGRVVASSIMRGSPLEGDG